MKIFTANNLLIFQTIFVFISTLCKACVIHQNIGSPEIERSKAFEETYKKKKHHWEETVPRNVYSQEYKGTLKSCVCGVEKGKIPPDAPEWQVERDPGSKTWNIYIFIVNETIPFCTGTIINDKMVLTSHNCLKSGKPLATYERWRPKPTHHQPVGLITAENLIMSPQAPFTPGLPFNYPVVEIIHNEQFDITSNNSILHDVAILVSAVQMHCFALKPICIPSVQHFDPVGLKAYYYGIGGLFPNDPTFERRSVGDAVIMQGEQCDEVEGREGFSGQSALCIETRLPVPLKPGGPLIIPQDGIVNKRGFAPAKTVFLMGIASMTNATAKGGEDTHRSFVYFSDINPLVKYLEYYAYKVNGSWCPPKDISTTMPRIEKDKRLLKKYDWEEASGEIKRDESLDCVCGVRNKPQGSKSRIFGGMNASKYEYPWLAMYDTLWIRMGNEPGNPKRQTTCGAAIINDRLVLTAAHCVIFRERLFDHKIDLVLPKEGNITLRKHFYDSKPETDANVIVAKVKQIYFHELHTESIRVLDSQEADIALLELESPIAFSNVKEYESSTPGEIRPICVPRQGQWIDFVGKEAEVAGWGVQPDDSDPVVLKKVKQPFQSLELCASKVFKVVSDSIICAGGFSMNDITSQGDSGGPLIFEKDGHWVVLGLVSFGQTEAAGTVSFFTNVQKYVRFIDYYSQKIGAKWCKSYI